MEGANLVLSRAPLLEPVVRLAGRGGATIVLEDLGADAPATVTRAEFGMCAGHGVRSPTSSKVQEAGPSHGLGRGVRPLRSLRGAGRLSSAFLGTRALLRPIDTFKIPTAWGSPSYETFEVSAANKNMLNLGPTCKKTCWT